MILLGWKQIAEKLGKVNTKTAREVARKYGLPVATINGHPAITELEMDIWITGMMLRERKPYLFGREK